MAIFFLLYRYCLMVMAFGYTMAENGDDSQQKTGLFVLKKKGYRLINSIFQSKHVPDQMICANHCILNKPRCKSFNYNANSLRLSSMKTSCELNSEVALSDESNLQKSVGVDYFETVQQVIKTCSSLKDLDPDAPSRFYEIQPSQDKAPFTVFCNMTHKNGVGVTVIGHDSEERTLVEGFEAPGSYKRAITYKGASMKQIEHLINASTYCEQFVKYECYGAGFHFWIPDSWWVSRQGKVMKNWGGADLDHEKCACGMTSSCHSSDRYCNCDRTHDMWQEDSGFLTAKDFLPVKELRFGDTGDLSEKGYHTLGKLLCWD